jgi:hypothetical protein
MNVLSHYCRKQTPFGIPVKTVKEIYLIRYITEKRVFSNDKVIVSVGR